jgi:L-fuculose-phosphate aldolase
LTKPASKRSANAAQSTLEHAALRQEIIDACLEMNAIGLNQGTSGNISARVPGGMLITPSGMPYKLMRPEDIVFMRMDGTYDGDLVPSTEWRFHLDLQEHRPEINAVVHAHPTFSTTLAILGREIPALHYMVAVAGGPDIRLAAYATFGTAELSQNILKAMDGRKACLMDHHGMLATGPDLAKALWLAVEVETLAKQYYYTLQLGGPPLLPDAEIANVAERIKAYGPDAQKEAAKARKRATIVRA